MNNDKQLDLTGSIDIQIYAKAVHIDFETGLVNLDGVDVGNVIAEFPSRDVLEVLDYSDIIAYVAENEKDKADMLAEEQADRER